MNIEFAGTSRWRRKQGIPRAAWAMDMFHHPLLLASTSQYSNSNLRQTTDFEAGRNNPVGPLESEQYERTKTEFHPD